MKTYRINGSVVGGKYLGEVEAESAEEAIKKAYDELDISVSLCHFCSDECENADVESISAYSDDGESATDADDLRARIAKLEELLAETLDFYWQPERHTEELREEIKNALSIGRC